MLLLTNIKYMSFFCFFLCVFIVSFIYFLNLQAVFYLSHQDNETFYFSVFTLVLDVYILQQGWRW